MKQFEIDESVRRRAEAEWQASAAIRAEFASKETYVAYCNAIESGTVRFSPAAPGLSRTTSEAHHGAV